MIPGKIQRIAVVGTTGSGKTMTAIELSRRLGISHVELDALYWGPDWTESKTEDFRTQVGEVIKSDSWIVDGNYSVVRDIIWPRAQIVVWLDYSLPIIMWQLTRRTFRRIILREELWNGCVERFWPQFFSRESIFLWALKTYRTRRKKYPELFAKPENAHLSIIRLRSPKMANKWIFNFEIEQKHEITN